MRSAPLGEVLLLSGCWLTLSNSLRGLWCQPQ